jgi:taurine dioxygenase
MASSARHVRPVAGALGVEVDGVDLAAVDDGRWAELHRLWLSHLVQFFPGQHLTPDEHVALGRRSDLTGPVRS